MKKNPHQDLHKITFVLIFFVFIGALGAIFGAEKSMLIVFACVIGGYMAMNIGANDVANNVGPAVGSRAISLFWAIFLAFVCEAAGAILAGADVVSTVKSGIINQKAFTDAGIFINIMLSALIASALWLHLATFLGAPVSTTHSIVGGIMGSGVMAGGFAVVQWNVMGKIAASWIISPVLGGAVAALLLFFIKHAITYQSDQRRAAIKIMPFLIALMSFAFCMYVALKGLKNLAKFDPQILILASFGISVAVFFITRPIIAMQAKHLKNKDDVNALFAVPLIFGAGFLSFAHGANDVANAIGPLAAINQMLNEGVISAKSHVPFWILLIGGLGISVGLALYGQRLIRTVGSQITDLNKIRAFCVAMSAAITVLIATYFGLPVSSTHIALGAIFGIGFLREILKNRYRRILFEISARHKSKPKLDEFLKNFHTASVSEKQIMLKNLKKNSVKIDKKGKKELEKIHKEQLVKRSAVNKIIASWLITVPASAGLSALCFFVIKSVHF